jgi:hypothetical protein
MFFLFVWKYFSSFSNAIKIFEIELYLPNDCAYRQMTFRVPAVEKHCAEDKTLKLRAQMWRKREEVTAVEICLMRSSIDCIHSRNSESCKAGFKATAIIAAAGDPKGRDHYLKNNLGGLVPWNSFELLKILILIKSVMLNVRYLNVLSAIFEQFNREKARVLRTWRLAVSTWQLKVKIR